MMEDFRSFVFTSIDLSLNESSWRYFNSSSANRKSVERSIFDEHVNSVRWIERFSSRHSAWSRNFKWDSRIETVCRASICALDKPLKPKWKQKKARCWSIFLRVRSSNQELIDYSWKDRSTTCDLSPLVSTIDSFLDQCIELMADRLSTQHVV